MPPRTFRLVLATAALSLLAEKSVHAKSPVRPTDFSGNWALATETNVDPSHAVRARESAAEESGRRARTGSGSGGVVGDLPLEAVTDVPWVGIKDEGAIVRITYSSGRKRVFYTDGEERQLDDGGGPAKTVAKRKGDAGEKIVVSSKWSTGHTLVETWELLSSPPRLSVIGKASGRESYKYERLYTPAPPGPPPTPKPAITPPPRPTPTPRVEPEGETIDVRQPGGEQPVPPPLPAGMSACTIKPPKGSTREELAGMAKIDVTEAQRRAIASVAPWRVTSTISSEVEVDQGCLVYSFVMRFADKKGVQETVVDAGDGRVLESTFEAK